MSRKVCQYYLQGRCRFGQLCRDLHPSSNSNALGGSFGGWGGSNSTPLGNSGSFGFNAGKEQGLGGASGTQKAATAGNNEEEIASILSTLWSSIVWKFSSISIGSVAFDPGCELQATPEMVRWEISRRPREEWKQLEQQLGAALETKRQQWMQQYKQKCPASKYSPHPLPAWPEEKVVTLSSPFSSSTGFGGPSPFGASSEGFGTSGGFGTPASTSPFGTSSNTFGTPAFGATSSGFGTSTDPFGASSSAFGTGPFGSSGFGSTPGLESSASGSSGTSGVFGSSSSPFGSVAVASPFGAAAPAVPNLFGTSAAASSSAFGTSLGAFGTPTGGFGTPPPTPFGSSSPQQPSMTTSIMPFGISSSNQTEGIGTATPVSPFGTMSGGFGTSSSTAGASAFTPQRQDASPVKSGDTRTPPSPKNSKFATGDDAYQNYIEAAKKAGGDWELAAYMAPQFEERWLPQRWPPPSAFL